jgi:hypothetical protein
MEDLLRGIYAFFGVVYQKAAQVVDWYVSALLKATLRFAGYSAAAFAFIGIGLLFKHSYLVAIGWFAESLLLIGYYIVAIPAIGAIRAANEIPWLKKTLSVIPYILVQAMLFVGFVIRMDAARKPGLLASLSIIWITLIAWNIFSDQTTINRFSKPLLHVVGLYLILCIVLPGNINMIMGKRMRGIRNWFGKPEEIAYNGGKIECFDPVDGSLKCWKHTDAKGVITLYDMEGYDVETRKPFEEVTDVDIATFKAQYQKAKDEEERQKREQNEKAEKAARAEQERQAQLAAKLLAEQRQSQAVTEKALTGGIAPTAEPVHATPKSQPQTVTRELTTLAKATLAPTPEIVYQEVRIPRGVDLQLTLREPIKADYRKDRVLETSLRQPVTVKDVRLLPVGTIVHARIDWITTENNRLRAGLVLQDIADMAMRSRISSSTDTVQDSRGNIAGMILSNIAIGIQQVNEENSLRAYCRDHPYSPKCDAGYRSRHRNPTPEPTATQPPPPLEIKSGTAVKLKLQEDLVIGIPQSPDTNPSATIMAKQ